MKSGGFCAAAIAAGLTLSGFVAVGASPARAGPDVVASIKPVHSLVASVMAGAGTPHLIIDGAQSPHSYGMRPSDAAALQSAAAVFWIGDHLETALARPLDALAGDATVVTLSAAPELVRFGFREDGPFDPHDDHGDDHHDDEDDHGDGEIDQHLWLDPQNAAVMVTEIVGALAALDPAQANLYAANGQATLTRIGALSEEISSTLDGLSEVPFVVFHDAYQYFENRFDVHAVGSITVVPDTPPSARRIREIHQRIRETGAVCVFAEPQFNARTVDLAADATGGRVGLLDPLGAEIAAGPDHYFTLMRQMAATMRACLTGTG